MLGNMYKRERGGEGFFWVTGKENLGGKKKEERMADMGV